MPNIQPTMGKAQRLIMHCSFFEHNTFTEMEISQMEMAFVMTTLGRGMKKQCHTQWFGTEIPLIFWPRGTPLPKPLRDYEIYPTVTGSGYIILPCYVTCIHTS